MGKSQQTFNKKEREKKRQKRKKEKLERREQRKLEKAEGGKKSFEEQLSYVDEFGNVTSTPPDPSKKKKVKVEDIVLGIPKREKVHEDPNRTGKVKFFNDEKGYGFIVDATSNESIFVHINNTLYPIQENDKVSFILEKGPKGPTAMQVKLVE
jgi:cold shock CspA family protein